MCLLLIATPAAFSASPNSTVAANVVGAMLTRWHYLSIAAPLLLLLLHRPSKRDLRPALLLAAIVLASTQAVVDMRIRAIRNSSVIPISARSATDPVRRRFGLMHGFSALLLLAEAGAAAIAVANQRETSAVEAT